MSSTPMVDYLEHHMLNSMRGLISEYTREINQIQPEHQPHHWMHWARAQIQMFLDDLEHDLPQYRKDCKADAPFHGETSNSQNDQNSLEATRTPDQATNAIR